jgi:hypothetical protein
LARVIIHVQCDTSEGETHAPPTGASSHLKKEKILAFWWKVTTFVDIVEQSVNTNKVSLTASFKQLELLKTLKL